MADTKIEMKVEEEIKALKELCEKMSSIVKSEIDKGIENVDTKELGEAIDMIKDLAEAKEHTVKACYYKQIMSAMEDSEYGEDYDEEGPLKYYSPSQPRNRYGEFKRRKGYTSTPITYMRDRDMDLDKGMMYYTEGVKDGMNRDGMMRDYDDGRMRNYDKVTANSRFDRARRNYTESVGSNSEKARKLEELWNVVEDELKPEIPHMSPEEKTMLKTKATKWIETNLK